MVQEDGSTTPAAAVSPLLDEDCGFCVYMRAGPCGREFKAWEDCVRHHQARNEDFARKCISTTRVLTKCMAQPHAKEYYQIPGFNEAAEGGGEAKKGGDER